ncbi:MAG: asparaginase [Candidatus Kariarchaeaceae archaeon]
MVWIKKVVILGMGGTISSVFSDKGFTPDKSTSELLALVPELSENYDIETREIMSIDSSNIQPENWVTLANSIYEEISRRDIDGVVITHGTDGLSYSASAVALMVQRHGKPIVFTGSQIPLSIIGSDGRKNLIDAVRVAGEANLAENVIVFNSRILRSVRTLKLREYDLDAFECVDPAIIGDIAYSIHLHDPTVIMRSSTSPRLNPELNPNCALLRVFPGMRPEMITNITKIGYEGLVLEGFGAGNVPIMQNSLLPAIRELTENNVPVVITSQCVFGSTELLYETGKLASDAGAIQGLDLVSEVALIKLMQVLSRTKDLVEIEKFMQTNYVGEINPSISKRI